ncbi:MAG TPA: uracil-DNA glycosylase [Ramlibacter sp.]|jgi:uracil-DNA glycosylase|uniref:uracil-DNA glycosylase n=1 Tax=Ramlibacter sp. TaxID=1917967 RepID=UPI002D3A320B|nr:uracil-DNA glycosylase [Ramlibacter sp.]HZY17212.1 uracil-DNA glycosylase [Ramlibacter sp.]
MGQASLPLGAADPPKLARWDPPTGGLAAGWQPVVDRFFAAPAGQALTAFLRERLAQGAVIYPPRPLRALETTPLAAVRAVILGQDPYHGPGQAEGLAFSVPAGVRLPPSLRNIFKELGCGTDRPLPPSGSLLHWAQQGVLLLNASLTVEDGQAGSHARKGWEALTDMLLAEVAARASPCVYLLWGAHAQAKARLIEDTAAAQGREILVLQANHPSPLSAARPPVPFLGCGHFAQARQWLAGRGHPGFFV